MQYPKIQSVQPVENLRLLVTFDNGITKEYDCHTLLESDSFKPLRDATLFKQVTVGHGGYGVEWGDTLDVAESELWLHGKTL